MSEYILFAKWSIKNPYYIFLYFCKKIFNIYRSHIKKKNNYFDKYNLHIKKTVIPKRKKINIIIDLAGYKLKVNNKINWHKNFLDPESEERLHRLSWIIDLISSKRISKDKIEWCEYQILDWYNEFLFELNIQNKNDCKWSPYTVSERISNIYLFYNLLDINVPESIKPKIEQETFFLLNNLEYFKNSINNHIINNSRAIYFSGLMLNKKKFLIKAKKIFLSNYKKLITQDGFLREGSSNYQLIFHRWIIELMYFAKYKDYKFHKLLNNLSKKLYIGSNFFICDKNNFKVVNFGDISPDFKSQWINSILSFNGKKKNFECWSNLFANGKNNKLITKNLIIDKKDIVSFPNSGWYKIQKFNHTIFFKLSKIEPKNYPGHFHFDQGHFIYFYKGKEVFGDTGRLNYLKLNHTFAKNHNTITLNDLGLIPNKKQLPFKYLISKNKIKILNKEKYVELSLEMSGFKRINKNINWIRKIILYKRKIAIFDEIKKCPPDVKIKSYFHTKKNIYSKSSKFEIISKNLIGKMHFSNNLKLKKKNYYFSPDNYCEKKLMTKIIFENNVRKTISNFKNQFIIDWDR